MNAVMRLVVVNLLGVCAVLSSPGGASSAWAQTRDYNPMRRGTPTTDAQLQEFSAPPRRFAPEGNMSSVRTASAASNNQWRSMRQPVRPRAPAPPLTANESQMVAQQSPPTPPA